MPKRVNLTALKVKSFVTSLERIEQHRAKGGIIITESCNPCGTAIPCITCSACTCPDYCTFFKMSCTCNTCECTIDCTIDCHPESLICPGITIKTS
jgi:hypothetical protein